MADLVPDETPTDAPHEAQTTADIHALIPIETGTIGTQQGILTVDGRKVWEWLEIAQEYATWVKNQIARLKFIENKHYVTFDEDVKRKEGVRGASIRTEDHFTLDAAQHIALASRTPRGKQARPYFIDTEEQYRTQQGGYAWGTVTETG